MRQNIACWRCARRRLPAARTQRANNAASRSPEAFHDYMGRGGFSPGDEPRPSRTAKSRFIILVVSRELSSPDFLPRASAASVTAVIFRRMKSPASRWQEARRRGFGFCRAARGKTPPPAGDAGARDRSAMLDELAHLLPRCGSHASRAAAQSTSPVLARRADKFSILGDMTPLLIQRRDDAVRRLSTPR